MSKLLEFGHHKCSKTYISIFLRNKHATFRGVVGLFRKTAKTKQNRAYIMKMASFPFLCEGNKSREDSGILKAETILIVHIHFLYPVAADNMVHIIHKFLDGNLNGSANGTFRKDCC